MADNAYSTHLTNVKIKDALERTIGTLVRAYFLLYIYLSSENGKPIFVAYIVYLC